MAISQEARQKYTPTIGIECHVQLKTKTKLFSGAGNDARQAAPNTLISHIDTGMPGALPVLNEKALELAVRAAFALNTQPQKHSYFERKHYFYPDSPAGYQISQLHAPIIVGGSVEVIANGQKTSVSINRVQLEADAGKTTHPAGADYSLVDLNRAGTPLLEIVSEPQIHSPAEAKAYARELYLLMKYADVSDVDLYHGNMRFDVNVSVSSDAEKLGIRTEVKNLNSFRSVENAVSYEIDRQIELYEKGQAVEQETRGWDEAKQKTMPQRLKEEAQDYRYMPEPDIPPIELSDEYIEKIKSEMPKLPKEIREILNKSSISDKSIDALLERNGEHGLNYVQRIEEAASVDHELAEFTAKYIINDYFGLSNWAKEVTGGAEPAAPYLPTLQQLYDTYDLLKNNKISSTGYKSLLSLLKNDSEKAKEIAEKFEIIQISDESEIEKIVAEVLGQNQQATQDVKNGEMKAIGYLVGQVMAASQGKANPQVAQDIIKKQLGL